jgi:hypothetical protein
MTGGGRFGGGSSGTSGYVPFVRAPHPARLPRTRAPSCATLLTLQQVDAPAVAGQPRYLSPITPDPRPPEPPATESGISPGPAEGRPRVHPEPGPVRQIDANRAEGAADREREAFSGRRAHGANLDRAVWFSTSTFRRPRQQTARTRSARSPRPRRPRPDGAVGVLDGQLADLGRVDYAEARLRTRSRRLRSRRCRSPR